MVKVSRDLKLTKTSSNVLGQSWVRKERKEGGNFSVGGVVLL